MKDDLEKLILRAQKGDNKALCDLIKKEQTNIYTTLFYLKKDENDIADIMQDVLIKLTKRLNQLKNPTFFKTWLNQIIINSYYDYLRKNKKKILTINPYKPDEEVEFEIPDNSTNPQNTILYTELDNIIKNAIQSLPIQYKIPIALREIQGLSYDEISNITNTSIGTVKSRISRARAKIKDDIARYSRS